VPDTGTASFCCTLGHRMGTMRASNEASAIITRTKRPQPIRDGSGRYFIRHGNNRGPSQSGTQFGPLRSTFPGRTLHDSGTNNLALAELTIADTLVG
jgi:hypothetical protein